MYPTSVCSLVVPDAGADGLERHLHDLEPFEERFNHLGDHQAFSLRQFDRSAPMAFELLDQSCLLLRHHRLR
jgi:hypothetical protein